MIYTILHHRYDKRTNRCGRTMYIYCRNDHDTPITHSMDVMRGRAVCDYGMLALCLIGWGYFDTMHMHAVSDGIYAHKQTHTPRMYNEALAGDMDNEARLDTGQPVADTTDDGIYDMDDVRCRPRYDVRVRYHDSTQPGDE